jgi:predicted RNA-binding protein YlxR (DUF448 family)/ribosomal protein L30E
MAHHQQRTCIGCKGVFDKNEVIRIVAGPKGLTIDYREKLPGRAAYVCPRRECIGIAFSRNQVSRALRTKVTVPTPSEFSALLGESIRQRIFSLLAMSAKAGRLVSGYSAVEDALRKGRVHLLLFATDVSERTLSKVLASCDVIPAMRMTLFTNAELGAMLGRDLVGIVGIHEKGFADALWREWQRLKGLINTHA